MIHPPHSNQSDDAKEMTGNETGLAALAACRRAGGDSAALHRSSASSTPQRGDEPELEDSIAALRKTVRMLKQEGEI